MKYFSCLSRESLVCRGLFRESLVCRGLFRESLVCGGLSRESPVCRGLSRESLVCWGLSRESLVCWESLVCRGLSRESLVCRSLFRTSILAFIKIIYIVDILLFPPHFLEWGGTYAPPSWNEMVSGLFPPPPWNQGVHWPVPIPPHYSMRGYMGRNQPTSLKEWVRGHYTSPPHYLEWRGTCAAFPPSHLCSGVCRKINTISFLPRI